MKKYDLIVVGGGLTGVAAAVSAARQGLQVLLAEQSGCLGGALSTNLIYPFMPFSTRPEPGVRKDLSAGLFKEMFLRSQAITAKIGPASVAYPEPSMSTSRSDICHEHVKFALDDMVQEAGVDFLYSIHWNANVSPRHFWICIHNVFLSVLRPSIADFREQIIEKAIENNH